MLNKFYCRCSHYQEFNQKAFYQYDGCLQSRSFMENSLLKAMFGELIFVIYSPSKDYVDLNLFLGRME